ncbi:hypothetical protein [Thiocystis violacea]|nr:hypothetical protein [Thiocystis violacea]
MQRIDHHEDIGHHEDIDRHEDSGFPLNRSPSEGQPNQHQGFLDFDPVE